MASLSWGARSPSERSISASIILSSRQSPTRSSVSRTAPPRRRSSWWRNSRTLHGESRRCHPADPDVLQSFPIAGRRHVVRHHTDHIAVGPAESGAQQAGQRRASPRVLADRRADGHFGRNAPGRTLGSFEDFPDHRRGRRPRLGCPLHLHVRHRPSQSRHAELHLLFRRPAAAWLAAQLHLVGQARRSGDLWHPYPIPHVCRHFRHDRATPAWRV